MVHPSRFVHIKNNNQRPVVQSTSRNNDSCNCFGKSRQNQHVINPKKPIYDPNSGQNVKVVVQLYKDFEKGDLKDITPHLVKDINWLDQTGSPRTKGGIAGHYEGKEQVLDFFSKLDSGYHYHVYDPYEFIESVDGLNVTVVGHDSGNYADDGKSFITEWNHLWTFDREGLVQRMRACNGEMIGQNVIWDHRAVANRAKNKKEIKTGMENVQRFYKLFREQKYEEITSSKHPILDIGVDWLEMGRAQVEDIEGVYKGREGLKKYFNLYRTKYHFFEYEPVEFIPSLDGTVITVMGHDSGKYLDYPKLGFTTQWNHVYYLNDRGLISKCRFISPEIVMKLDDMPSSDRANEGTDDLQ